MRHRKLTHYLKTYRKRAGLTQDEVAYLLGYKSGAKISRLERMKRKPTLVDLLGYEVLFRAPVRDLVAGLFEEVERSTVRRIGVLARKIHRRKPGALTEQKLDALALAVRAFNRSEAERHD